MSHLARMQDRSPTDIYGKVLDLAECCLDRAATMMARGQQIRSVYWQLWRKRVLAYGVGHEVLCDWCGVACTMTLDYREDSGDLWLDLDGIDDQRYRCLNLGPLAFAEDRIPKLLRCEYLELCDRHEASKLDDPEYVAELKAQRRLDSMREGD